MKFKNNLTREAFEESYRNQGYDEEQIEALMWMLDDELDFLSLMSPNISGEHILRNAPYYTSYEQTKPTSLMHLCRV